MVNKKMTLDQVKARKPAMEYDGEYGRAAGRSSDQFVEAVYSRSGLQRAQADGRSSLIEVQPLVTPNGDLYPDAPSQDMVISWRRPADTLGVRRLAVTASRERVVTATKGSPPRRPT